MIPFESEWKYLDDGEEPGAQDSEEWYSLDYNDNSWEEGPGQFGYNDNDEATVLDSDVTTGYFRHSFEVDDPNAFQQLILNILFDDGAVVYLNGEEVWRVNMPSGDIDYDTYASSTSDENETRSLMIVRKGITK